MPLPRLPFALAFLLLTTLTSTTGGATLELLRNGGFEQGAGGWSGAGLSSGGCEPRSGAGALAIEADATVAFAQQNVRGPLGEGSYALNGYLMVASGTPRIEVILTWLDEDGSELERESKSIGGGASYGSFSHHSSRPAGAESLRVRISVDSLDTATVCLDDLGLEGPPPPATPTTTPSPTLTSTTTPSATATPTSTPRPTSTPKPTSTQRPTATAVEPSPSPTATMAPEPDTGDGNRGIQPSNPSAPIAASTADAEDPTPKASEPKPQPTLVQEVIAIVASETLEEGKTPHPLRQATSGGDGVPSVWLAGAALFVAGLGGSYAFQRRHG